MLREEVTAEDVSEIVSRWTGIPVQVRDSNAASCCLSCAWHQSLSRDAASPAAFCWIGAPMLPVIQHAAL